MREIKFRAWDNNTEKMHEVDELDLWGRDSLPSRTYFKGIDVGIPYEDIELMQYTGLKDKSGKEIYEGDILRSDALGDDGEGVVSLVIFEKGCFVYGEGDGCPIKDYVYMDTVIGNIYENPELKILFGVK